MRMDIRDRVSGMYPDTDMFLGDTVCVNSVSTLSPPLRRLEGRALLPNTVYQFVFRAIFL